MSDFYNETWSYGRVPLYGFTDNVFHLILEGIVGINRLTDIGENMLIVFMKSIKLFKDLNSNNKRVFEY